MVRKKFQRKMNLLYEKDSRFNSRIIGKCVYLIGQTENSVFAIQHIENRKSFTEVLSPRDQTNPFAYCCSFTSHTSYKNGMIGHGGERCQNAQKQLL